MKNIFSIFVLLIFVITSMSFAQVNNTTHPGSGPYFTIQAAINNAATVADDIIVVAAGIYAENVTVNKAVDIRGPNYNISPNGGPRGAEAIVVPGTSSVGGEIFAIQANTSNVSINGFTIDGDNPSLTSGHIGTNGADIDAAEGVTVYYSGVNHVNVSNNIIQNLSYTGVDFFGAGDYSDANSAKTGNVISNNLIRNMGYYNTGTDYDSYSVGVMLYNSFYTNIANNVMTNVGIGIQTGNFQALHTGDPQYQVIANNSIQARYLGIFYNLHRYSPWTITNNTITGIDNSVQAGEANSAGKTWKGILLGSLGNNMGTSILSNNTIDGSGITLFTAGKEGINVWNVNSNSAPSISGGSISGVSTGIFLNNYEGYPSVPAVDGANANINNVTITATQSGIRLLDSPNSTGHIAVQANITNCTIINGINGILLNEASSAKVSCTATGNSITGQSGYGVNNTTTSIVDATNNWWGDATGPYDPKAVPPNLPPYNNPSGAGSAVTPNVAYKPWNNNALLPVELSSFTSNINGRNVQLNWETKTEKNSYKFDIEREVSSANWESIGSVKAAVLSNSPKQYSFTDKNLQAGKYQYRLKMIDNDGSFEYSKIVETEVTTPKNFELSQNYPNPFNPSTRIDYQVPVDAKVILEVYNIAGQKVVELVNQEQSAGYYTVDFGASKLSSGVYIYRIVASDKATGNNFSSIKKMMLLK